MVCLSLVIMKRSQTCLQPIAKTFAVDLLYFTVISIHALLMVQNGRNIEKMRNLKYVRNVLVILY